MLADMLRREDVEVHFAPPMECRSIEDIGATILLIVADEVADDPVGLSVSAVVRKTVDALKERFPQAEVDVQDPEADI
jgi:hypothetical protein